MTREMEERIVAMYFDNEDFEKKAKTTIETLGQLQKGLDLKESAKGFEVFDKIGKTLNFDKAQKGLTKIKTTLTGMTGIFKKVFNLGPIDEAAAAVENFKNRYLNRVLGFDLARTVANSLESAFRGLTIQPISAGWTQYQNKMDSVKTIMSSTGESIETVETHLQSLTDYANKTIYSLTDMTSNLGKFTNNGMKLEDSVQAMKGIANAAADAGQGAQQASMAMYNFSQAMGVGKMTTIDWKSIENANMATTRLKNTFIEMAAAQGELHKEFSETDKKYHYYITKNSKGQVEKDQKKWTEVTAKNFRETLSKDWLTAEAMMHALMVYSGEALDPDTLKSWGITDPELIKSFEEIGQNALTAATQVRTFGKMMDALKEAAQSGWADTFELIFGNMEQGTTLWTGINEVLDGILSKSAEARNNMLRIWAGSTENTEEEEAELKSKTESLKALEEYLGKLEEETDIDKTTARIEELRASIQRYKDDISDLRKNQNKGNKESTQVQIDRRLKKIEELEASVKELEARNKKNVTAQKNQDTMNDLEERIRAYQAEIQTLRNADAIDSETNADASAKRQKQIAEKEKAMKKLQEQLDKLRQTTGTDEIEKTKKEIEALKKEIDELNGVIDEKNSKPKSEFVDEQGRSGRDILFDRETGALFRLIDLAQEFGKTFSDAFHSAFGFMDAEKLFNLTRDFGKAVERVVEWFGKANEEGSRLNKIQKGLQGVFSILKTVVNFVKMGFNLFKRLVAPVADFAINAFEKVFGFFDGLGDLKPVEVFQKLGEGLQKTWEKVKKFFSPKDVLDKNGKATGQQELPVITWLKNTWEGLKSTVRGWANDVGLGDVYNNVAQWWETFKSSINTAFEGIQTWWKGTGISEFFTNMWNSITGAFQPKANVVSGYRNGRLESWYEEAPIVSWLTGIWDGVKSVWNSITSWEGWSTIATFASNTWGWITSQFKSSGNVVSGYRNGRLESWYEEAPIVSWLTGIWDGVKSVWNSITSWEGWSTIATFASNTWGWITSKFKSSGNVVSGYRNGRLESWYEEAPIVSWLTGIWDGVKSVWNSITSWEGWSTIATFASNTWGWITSQFKSSGNVVSGYRNGRLESWYEEAPIVSWLTGIWDGVKSVWNSIISWEGWSTIATFASNTWGWITSQFKSSGNVVSGYRNGRLESWYEEAPIVSWLSGIWEDVKSVWDSITGWEGWQSIGKFFTDIWGWIMDLVGNNEKKETTHKVFGRKGPASKVRENAEEIRDAIKASADTNQNVSIFERIIGAIANLFDKVKEAASNITGLPELSKFMESLGTFMTGVLTIITKILDALGNAMKGDFSGFADPAVWVTGILAVITTIFDFFHTKHLSNIDSGESFARKFLELAGGLMLLATAVATLSAIDQSKMWPAVGAVAALGAVIGVIVGLLTKLNQTKNQTANAGLTGGQQIVNNLVNQIGKIGMIAVAMSLLPGVIKTIGEVKKDLNGESIGKDVLDVMLGLSALIASVSVVFAITQKLTSGKGLDIAGTAKTVTALLAGLGILLAAFGAGGWLIGLIGDENVKATAEKIDNLATVLRSIGGAIGGFFGSLFGGGTTTQKADETKRTMESLAEASEIFDSEKVSGISRMMTLIENLTKRSQSIDPSKLDGFAEAMGKLGAGIYQYVRFLTQEDYMQALADLQDPASGIYQRLVAFNDLGIKMGELFKVYGEAHVKDAMERIDYIAKDEHITSLVENLNKIMTRLGDLKDPTTGIQFDGVTIVERLYDAIQDGLINPKLKKFDATTVVDNILEAINIGSDSIALAVHNMVQAGIDASGKGENGEDYSGATQLIEAITNAGGANALTSDFSELEAQFFGEGGLLSSFTNLEDQIPSVENIFKDKGWMDFKDEEGNQIDIVSEIQTQLETLSDTINTTDPITVTITPVFDMTNMTPEKLQAALDQRFLNNPLLAQLSANNPSSQINLEDLKVQLGLDEIKNKLASLYEATILAGGNNVIAINGLKANVDGVANAVAGMRLVLDTGALVGQITPMVDLALGQRSRIFGRTGVIFTKP